MMRSTTFHNGKTIRTVFVIDAPDFVMMFRRIGKDCVFPAYRFDNEYDLAKRACEDIAAMKSKPVMNAVYSETDPLIYRPRKDDTAPKEQTDDYRSRLKGIIA